MRALLRAAASRATKGAALVVVFATSAAGAVVVHSDMPAARRAVALVAEQALARLFEGTFVLGGVRRLELGADARVRLDRVDVIDRDGRLILTAHDVEGRLALATLLRSLVTTGAPDVVVDEARIRDAVVVLDADVDGGVRLAHAFRPRTEAAAPAPEAPALPSSAEPAATPRVHIRRASVGHVWVHGDVVPPSGLDVEARAVLIDVAYEDGLVRIALNESDVTLRSPSLPYQRSPLVGRATAKLDVTVASSRLAGHASFLGETGGLPLSAEGSLDGDRVEATLDVPRATPEAVARAFPGLLLEQPVSLRATVKGAFPSLTVDAKASVGEGLVTALVDADLRGALGFTGVVNASNIDLRAFGGPASSLSARLSGTAAIQDGTAFGTFRLASEEGSIAGERVPPLAADGRFENRTLAVSARAEEPGVRAAANMVLDVPTKAITFDLQARATELRAVPRLRGKVSGSATARATGKVDLAKGTVSGAVTATGDGLSDGTTHVGSARVTAYVSGPLGAPVADASVDASDVRFATGGKAPLVYPEVTGRARVSFADFTARGVEVRARTSDRDPSLAFVAHADAIAFGGKLAVEGARVDGVGGPLEASVSHAGGVLRIRARGTDLDLGRAADATGLAFLRELPRGSRADVDVELESAAGRSDGHVDLQVRDGRGFDARLHTTLVRGRARGDARVALAPYGEVRARSFDVEVGALDRTSLERATGEIELDGTIDLAHGGALLASVLGRDDVQRVDGTLTFSARAERRGDAAWPVVRATVRTNGLSVTRDVEGKAETYRGVDVTAHAAWDGLSNDAEAAVVLWDGRSALATLDAKALLPLGAWVRGAERPTLASLETLDVELRADLVKRELRSLPAWLFPARPDGRLEGTLTSTGPLGRPNVVAILRGAGLRDKNRRRDDPLFGPVDASVDVRWDGEDVVTVVTADENEPPNAERRRERAEARGDGARGAPRALGSARGLLLARASAKELLLRGTDPGFRASAEIVVERLDLAPLPLPYNARGRVSGRFSVRDVNGDPTFNVTSRFQDLTLSNAAVGSGDVALGGRDGGLFGVARFIQEEGGSAQVQIVSKALGLKGREVSWDEEAETRLDYALNAVRLSIVRPLVRRLFPEIDGRIDGRGSVTLAAGTQTFDGGAAISDGRLYVNLLGEEVTNVNAMVNFEPSGVFRVREATGRIGEGDLRASVVGRMKGLHFEAANAAIVIPSKRGIPLSTEGATYAEATGQANLQMQMSPDRSTLLCAVDIPTARVSLPDRSTQQLQKTEDEPTISVGKRARDGSFDLAPLRQRGQGRRAGATTAGTNEAEDRPLVVRLTVSVGKDVWIEGRGMKIAANGLVLVEVADAIGVTGRIDLAEGTVDVQGRRFTIDRGTLTFLEGEDPSNPTLLASAYWDAPDGARVWAEFADPIATGKLTLRSEPPYSYDEILSLILFGRPEGNVGGGSAGSQGGAGARASGVAGGVVAPGLNRALDQLAGGELEIKANVASTQFQQQSRPEVNVRRGRVGVTVGYVLGAQSIIQPDRALVTFDWQFLPRWSLAATRGDASTTILDVLYRYRY